MSNRQKLKDLKLLRDHVSNANNATTSNTLDAILSLTPSKGKNGKKNSFSSTFALQVLRARIDAEILHLETPNKTSRATSHATTTRGSSSASTDTKHKPFSVILSTIRVIFLDIPMTLLFLFLTLSILIQQYYNHYVSPTIDAANWIHNDYERLQHEFTYYSRECDSSDITATSVQAVKLDPLKHKAQDAVDNFMIHGMTLFPSLLDSETATELRTYISNRNKELKDDEVIPLDGPANRLSFGIHANEHPSVAKALEQLSSNTLLEESMEKMLGADPAVAEITAISVAPGAEPQGWHSDVKELGNGLKYAQTFTHSYSIFIPLQDVTPEMGATELCPGTQYCADGNLHDLCVRHGFQAAGSRPEEIWKTGDGLAMDQRMWHRGSGYRGTGQHRIVFIITFISRPAFGVDHRQLSHGTYFHIHPHMYGHTFRDLKHASVSMSWPFAPLRSLGLWKPPNANWGWDWVTTSATRIANDQNGYRFDDLMNFVDHPIGLMIPHWLHGSMVDDDDGDDDSGGWQLYFKETFENFVYLGIAIYGVVLFIVLGMMLTLDVVEGFQHGRIGSFLRRILVVNGIILLLSYQAVLRVKSTTYAQSVEDGTIFANPFLQKPIGSIAEKVLNARLMGLDLTSAPKLTTVPDKRDILFGNRFDSKNIGYYSNFLNYHPGNIEWRKVLGLYSRLDQDYSGLPCVFRQQVQSVVKEHVESSGRMLTQNVFGEWTVMDEDDVRNAIDRSLVTGVDTLLAALDKAIAIVSADARHKPPLSGSRSIQVETLRNLDKWKVVIAPMRNNNIAPSKEYKKPKITNSLLRTSLTTIRSIPKSKNESKRQYKLAKGSVSEVKVGDMVLANFRGTRNYLPARIIYKEYKHYGVVKFNVVEGVYKDRDNGGERSNEYLKNVKPYAVVKEGDLVAVMSRECDRCPIAFEAGTIIRCFPDMICDVRYDEGDKEEVHKNDIALRFEF